MRPWTTAMPFTVAALLLTTGCSGHASVSTRADTATLDSVIEVTPTNHATACTALPTRAIEAIYHHPITKITNSPREPGQNLESECVVDIKDEPHTSLALYLWHGLNFQTQWRTNLTFVGDAALPALDYGIEAYGATHGPLTTVDLRERNFAVRLLCSSTPKAPTVAPTVIACAALVGGMADKLG